MRAVNLVPVEQRAGQPVGAGRSQGGAYAVLVLVGGLALLAFLYGQSSHQVASRRAQAASLAAQAQRAQQAAERLAPYTSFIALREQRTQAVDALVNSRFDWAHALHEFGRVLPPQTAISSLSGTIAAAGAIRASGSSGAGTSAAVASATPAGAVPTFSLSGCATSQPAVALTLERLRLIDGVNAVTLQSSSADGAGASSGADGCAGHDATFSATVTFDPLPSTSAVAAANRSVSDRTSSGSGAPGATTSGASAK
jgi:Tfp pilus assembly protein PilN